MVATRWRRSESDGPTSRCSPLPADVPVPALDGGGVVRGRGDASGGCGGRGVDAASGTVGRDAYGRVGGEGVAPWDGEAIAPWDCAGWSSAPAPPSLAIGSRSVGKAATASAPAATPATTRIASGRRPFAMEPFTARRVVGAATRSRGYQAPYPPRRAFLRWRAVAMLTGALDAWYREARRYVQRHGNHHPIPSLPGPRWARGTGAGSPRIPPLSIPSQILQDLASHPPPLIA